MSKALSWLQKGVGVCSRASCAHRHTHSPTRLWKEQLCWAQPCLGLQGRNIIYKSKRTFENCIYEGKCLWFWVWFCVLGSVFFPFICTSDFSRLQRPLKFWWNNCLAWVPNPGLYCTMQMKSSVPCFVPSFQSPLNPFPTAFCSLTEPYHWF